MTAVEGTVTPTDQPTIDQIATKRGIQTWAQGLAIDVGVALALVVLSEIVPAMSDWQSVLSSWSVWLLVLLRSTLQAVCAWAVRRWADQSGVEPIAAPTVIVGEVVGDEG